MIHRFVQLVGGGTDLSMSRQRRGRWEFSNERGIACKVSQNSEGTEHPRQRIVDTHAHPPGSYLILLCQTGSYRVLLRTLRLRCETRGRWMVWGGMMGDTMTMVHVNSLTDPGIPQIQGTKYLRVCHPQCERTSSVLGIGPVVR